MRLAELNISELLAPFGSVRLRDFVATGNQRTSGADFQAKACCLAKKTGMKAHSAVLTFLPLLVLALKRAPGADGGQSPYKEIYS